MSKMSELHRELSEQAYDLGFQSVEDAEGHEWRVNYEQARLEPPVVQPSLDEMIEQEKAHKAWLKEKADKLHTLRLTAELCRNSDMPNTADDLESIADFFEKGEC